MKLPFLNQFQQAVNPKQMLINMLQNNPQLQNTMNQLKNSSNGLSNEEMAKQMAKRQGISEEQLMQMYNSIAKK